MDINTQVDVLYTDFAKAFDKLNIDILLKRLSLFDIVGNILNCSESFLKNEFQRALFCCHTSNIILPTSEIPQGSSLSPLLFVIFIVRKS